VVLALGLSFLERSRLLETPSVSGEGGANEPTGAPASSAITVSKVGCPSHIPRPSWKWAQEAQ